MNSIVFWNKKLADSVRESCKEIATYYTTYS